MIDLLKDYIPYFRELNTKQLKKIENISQKYDCKNGDLIFLEGEYCQNWVFIYEGSFLTRTKINENSITEEILLEGQHFDFISTIKNSVTTKSLEAIGDCSLIVINTLGLKKITKSDPVIISLIKLQLEPDESLVWNDFILSNNKHIKKISLKVRISFLYTFIKILPFIIMTNTIFFLILFLIKEEMSTFYYTMLLIVDLTTLGLFWLNSRLTYVEINKEQAVKREFSVKNITSSNLSIPLDKIQNMNVLFKNRLRKIFKLGAVTIESSEIQIIIDGVYKPTQVINNINQYKNCTVDIDKAIELSSFKYLFSKQNDLFYINNQLEQDEKSIFTFKKSIIYLLVRTLPPFFIFMLSSLALFLLLRKYEMFLINIPSFLIVIWQYIDWNNDYYAFEGDKIIDIEKKPLFGREKRIVAEIISIQSVKKIQKNIFEILFNFGDIEVYTFGSKIIYPSINNPDKVIDNLYIVKKYYYSKKESSDKLKRQEEFLNYTRYYQELIKK